jgi:hypothetical protein
MCRGAAAVFVVDNFHLATVVMGVVILREYEVEDTAGWTDHEWTVHLSLY